MSIESATAYMLRMRDDAAFRKTVNEAQDPAANWAFLRENGYDFSIDDFKQAQKAVYEEHGTDALPYAEN